MLVLFRLAGNGKYDVTRKGKPMSTAPFSARVGGWSSAAATAAITARVPVSWSCPRSPRTSQAPIQIIPLANPEKTAGAELSRRGRLHLPLLVSQVDPYLVPPSRPASSHPSPA